MAITPSPSDDQHPHAGDASGLAGPGGSTELRRDNPAGTAAEWRRWRLEVLEPTLIDQGIEYTAIECDPTAADVGDAPNPTPKGAIDFWVPTRFYRNRGGHDKGGESRVLVRIAVEAGRLSITAPSVYLRGCLGTATDHTTDCTAGHGTLRVIRPHADDQPQVHLAIAADGAVTAVLDMESLDSRLSHRRQLTAVVAEFVAGIDVLDCAIDHIGLWRA